MSVTDAGKREMAKTADWGELGEDPVHLIRRLPAPCSQGSSKVLGVRRLFSRALLTTEPYPENHRW